MKALFGRKCKERVYFYKDFVLGVVKKRLFWRSVVLIALYEGYFCIPTAEGVATATTRTVIKGSLAVLGLNFVLTAFMLN